MSLSDTTIPLIELNDGVKIPQLGTGVFLVTQDDTVENVTTAFELGYRHIDGAMIYENEAEVGEAIKASDLAREDIFVTTKIWNADHGYHEATKAIQGSLERMQLDQLDLLLIHWPVASRNRYVDTWQAFIDAKEQGLTRSIGVSNFQPAHLRRIIEQTGVVPSVNQIELHPYLQQAELRREHADRGIVTEGWAPLAQGKILDDPLIAEIAESKGKSIAQVTLRWHVQLGNVVFPKSVTPERLKENLEVFDFELSDDEMARIETLNRDERQGPDPDSFDMGA